MRKGRASISSEVALYLGIRPGLSRVFIRVLRDCVLQELQTSGSCYIKGIGTFTLKLGKTARVNFRASPRLLDSVKAGVKVQNELDNKFFLQLSNVVEERRNKLFFDTLDAPKTSLSVSRHFAYYLKNRFPYDEPWINPQTKVEYTIGCVKQAIARYRAICPQEYDLLWVLWVSMECRAHLMNKYKISPDELILRWYKTIGSIIFILCNPELVPTKLEKTGYKDPEVEYRPPVKYAKKADYYLTPFLDRQQKR